MKNSIVAVIIALIVYKGNVSNVVFLLNKYECPKCNALMFLVDNNGALNKTAFYKNALSAKLSAVANGTKVCAITLLYEFILTDENFK